MTDVSLGTYDAFRDILHWDVGTAQQWAVALDHRAQSSDQRRLRATLVSSARLGPGDVAVEIGCGTGALLLDLAARVGDHGRIIGFEPQPVLAAAARERAAQSALAGRIVVRSAPGDPLPLADASAAACIAQTVLIHLESVTLARCLAEMVRVTRPGGRIVSADQDGDTWVIDHPDRVTTRRIVRFNSDQRYADGWTGRRLHRLFRASGLDGVRVEPIVHVDTEGGSYLARMAERIARVAAQVGVITADVCDRWLAELRETASAGTFFSSINLYVASGVRGGPDGV